MNSHCYLSMSLLFYLLFYLAILATTLVNICLLIIYMYNINCVQKKQSQRIFSIILFKTDEIFYKIWRSYSWVYSGHKRSCISNEACNTLTWDVLFDWRLVELKQRLLVECRKLGCLDCCCKQLSLSGVAVSLLMLALTVDILNTFYGVFVVQCMC